MFIAETTVCTDEGLSSFWFDRVPLPEGSKKSSRRLSLQSIDLPINFMKVSQFCLLAFVAGGVLIIFLFSVFVFLLSSLALYGHRYKESL